MLRFIIRRLLGIIPIFLGVIIVSFALMQMAPGGPEAAIQGQQRRLTNEQVDSWLARMEEADEERHRPRGARP